MEIEVEFLDMNMCIVCLSEKSEMSAVEFDGADCTNGPILVKHFWFQEAELHFKYICLECWTMVKQFHEFYLSVEKAHADVTQVSMAGEDLGYVEPEILSEVTLEPSKVETREPDVNQEFMQLAEDPETIAIEVERCEQDSGQSGSDDSSSEDEAGEEPQKRTRKKACRKNLDDSTEAEKLEKMFHKPIAEIEEEDRNIAEHCELVCENCGSSFATFIELQRHFREAHNTKGHIVCCNRTFRKRLRLVEHVTKFNNPDAFQCTACNKSFSNSSGLSLHMTTRHSAPEEKLFKCDQCGKSFAKKFQLNAHQLNQHVPEEEKTFICPKCNKAYATMTKLNAHIKLRHQPVEILFCKFCEKSFKSKIQFQRHQKEHDESYQAVRLQCKICSKWMKNASSLRKHIQRHDGEGQTHECEICGKQAPNVLALQSHISFVHKKEKLYQCHLCPKAFKRRFTLSEHITTHTGEVLYQCPFCVKTFNSSANMHAHKKKIHPQQWEESKRRSELPFAGLVESDVVDS